MVGDFLGGAVRRFVATQTNPESSGGSLSPVGSDLREFRQENSESMRPSKLGYTVSPDAASSWDTLNDVCPTGA